MEGSVFQALKMILSLENKEYQHLSNSLKLIMYNETMSYKEDIFTFQIHKSVGIRRPVHWCVMEWKNEYLSRGYGVYMYLIVLVIPVILMTFAYGSISIKLWRLRYFNADSSNK